MNPFINCPFCKNKINPETATHWSGCCGCKGENNTEFSRFEQYSTTDKGLIFYFFIYREYVRFKYDVYLKITTLWINNPDRFIAPKQLFRKKTSFVPDLNNLPALERKLKFWLAFS